MRVCVCVCNVGISFSLGCSFKTNSISTGMMITRLFHSIFVLLNEKQPENTGIRLQYGSFSSLPASWSTIRLMCTPWASLTMIAWDFIAERLVFHMWRIAYTIPLVYSQHVQTRIESEAYMKFCLMLDYSA